jgi:hypothetical protein
MSNGIASGVPPAEGGAGGVAGTGAGVCAKPGELSTAIAQAASVIETIERMVFSQVEIYCRCQVDRHRRIHIGGIKPSLP